MSRADEFGATCLEKASGQAPEGAAFISKDKEEKQALARKGGAILHTRRQSRKDR